MQGFSEQAHIGSRVKLLVLRNLTIPTLPANIRLPNHPPKGDFMGDLLDTMANAAKGVAAINRYIEYQLSELDNLELHEQPVGLKDWLLSVSATVNGQFREYIASDLSELICPTHPELVTVNGY